LDDLESLARATFRHAGIEATDGDLALVGLVYGGLLGQLAALEEADPATFPFEAVDPSRAPEPR
jgi:hypothetical protein